MQITRIGFFLRSRSMTVNIRDLLLRSLAQIQYKRFSIASIEFLCDPQISRNGMVGISKLMGNPNERFFSLNIFMELLIELDEPSRDFSIFHVHV